MLYVLSNYILSFPFCYGHSCMGLHLSLAIPLWLAGLLLSGFRDDHLLCIRCANISVLIASYYVDDLDRRENRERESTSV